MLLSFPTGCYHQPLLSTCVCTVQRTAGRRAAAVVISCCRRLRSVAICPKPRLGLLRTSSCGRLGARLLLLLPSGGGGWGGEVTAAAPTLRGVGWLCWEVAS